MPRPLHTAFLFAMQSGNHELTLACRNGRSMVIGGDRQAVMKIGANPFMSDHGALRYSN